MGELKQIGKTSWLDAPAKLRELADELEKEGGSRSLVIVVADEEQRTRVRAFGPRTSPLEVLGWLTLAKHLVLDPEAVEWLPGPAA